MLYEEDPDVGYLKYMGLSIKRRDSCDYLKDTYGEIINILMNEILRFLFWTFYNRFISFFGYKRSLPNISSSADDRMLAPKSCQIRQSAEN